MAIGAAASRGPAAPRPQALFVGRQPTLASLHRMLEQARAGGPRLVLIEGPAGIGKTSLVRRFLAEADERCVLRASGEAAEAGLPFGVLAQLLAAAPTTPPGPAAGVGGGDPVDPLAAGAVLLDLLGELQRTNPVVLVVDDLHWADQPSLRALTFALRRLRVDRVLTLALTRDLAEAPLPDGLRRLLADDDTPQLRLGGLEVEELRALSGQLGHRPLSMRAAARLRAHTDGNPLHARTLLEQLPAEAFDDPQVPLPAPRSFALLVLARLAACAADVQELVAAASVLGMRCPLHQAAALAKLDDPLPALEQAVAAGLLVEQPATLTVGFPHPLVHAAIYQQLGPARRAELHTRAAGLVDEEPARLHHRVRAASGPDPALAADLARAGRRHTTVGAWASAAEHLATAARLAPSQADHEQLTLEAIECQVLTGDVADPAGLTARLRTFRTTGWRSYILARLALVAGRLDQAEALLGDAWRRCDPATDPALGARIAGQLASLCMLQLRGQDAADWADLALRLAPEQTATELIHDMLLVGRGISGHADTALAAVATLPDPAVASVAELDTLLGRGLLRTWTDDLAGARQDLAGVLAAAHDQSVAFRLLVATMLGQAEYRLGYWDDAVVHCDLAVSIAADADQTGFVGPLYHAIACLVRAARGQWGPATAHAEAAQRGAVPGYLAYIGYGATATAQLARARGQPEAVVAALDPLLHLERRDGIDEPAVFAWHDLLVDALVAVGEHDQAAAVLGPFEAMAATRGRHSAMAAAARARANLEAARGDYARADQASRPVLPTPPRSTCRSTARCCSWPTARSCAGRASAPWPPRSSRPLVPRWPGSTPALTWSAASGSWPPTACGPAGARSATPHGSPPRSWPSPGWSPPGSPTGRRLGSWSSASRPSSTTSATSTPNSRSPPEGNSPGGSPKPRVIPRTAPGATRGLRRLPSPDCVVGGGMRFVLDLRHTAQGVEGEVTREGSAAAEPFSGWLELLRLLEVRDPPMLSPVEPDPPSVP